MLNRLAIVTNVVGASMILLATGIIIYGVVSVIDSGDHSCDGSLLPSLISIMNTGLYIEISWYNPYPNSQCHLTYFLQYVIDNKDKHSLNLTETTYTIPNIEICSVLEVHLRVGKEDGEASKEYQSQNYTAFPHSGYISDVQFLPNDEGILARWNHSLPRNKCGITYQVIYFSELGAFSKEVDSEEVMIPQETFCFGFQLEITAYIDHINVSYRLAEYDGGEEVEDIKLSINSENINELAVSWKHNKEKLCSLKYNVDYHTPAGLHNSLEVPSAKVTLNIFYCEDVTITITPISARNTEGPPTITNTILYLEHIDSLTDIIIIPQNETTLISWTALQQIGKCHISYQLEFATDVDSFTKTTDTSSLELDGSFYCFNLVVEVSPFIKDIFGKSVLARTTYDLAPIEKLYLTTTLNTLMVTWPPHIKQEQCGVEYEVTYEYGDTSQVIESNQTSMSFDLAFCDTMTVRIKAITNNRESVETKATHIEEYPSTIQMYQNMQITWTNNSAIWSWDPPSSVTKCSTLMNSVTAINLNTGDVGTCRELINCEIILNNFCPTIEFTLNSSMSPEIKVTQRCPEFV